MVPLKNRFSIGKMSNLHNIPVKTLRYYDEIDLFKPIEIDPDNGYRYYSVEQFKLLDIINYLKTLGVPLKEIKEQINNRNINDFLNSLKEHRKFTEQKINELEMIKERIEGRIEEISESSDITAIDIPVIKTKKEKTVIRMYEAISSAYELELSLRKLKNELHPNAPLFIGKVGLTISSDEIRKGNYNEYNSICLLLEEVEKEDINHHMVTHFPHGEYACIYYRGGISDASDHLKALQKYVNDINYKAKGDFIIRNIVDQFISNDENEYLTEIQLPIMKK